MSEWSPAGESAWGHRRILEYRITPSILSTWNNSKNWEREPLKRAYHAASPPNRNKPAELLRIRPLKAICADNAARG